MSAETTVQRVKELLGLPATASNAEVIAEYDRREARRLDLAVAAAATDGRILDTASNRAKWRRLVEQPGGERTLASLAAPARVAATSPAQQQKAEPAYVSTGLAALWASPSAQTVQTKDAPTAPSHGEWFAGYSEPLGVNP